MQIEPIPAGPRKISPTDVAQFIRLEQCERYIRLRLYGRNVDSSFMRDYGVVPQSIPPMLTRSGAAFEEAVEEAVRASVWSIHFVRDLAHAGHRADDNARVAQIARELTPGETVVLFQPRLAVTLGAWLLRGDIDLLRLERDGAGTLRILIADMKSSTAVRVEHRLQVAFYHEMLRELLADADVAHEPIELGILHRGPDRVPEEESDEEIAAREEQRAAARTLLHAEAYLELLGSDVEEYTAAVQDLVTDPQSVAARVAGAEFDSIPFHLTYKCDGCMFNEFCMRWSAEHDDLSLLPWLTPEDKRALQRAGIETMRELATLKEPVAGNGWQELVPAPGRAALARELAATWPVGPRLDELIIRARSYRRSKGEGLSAPSYIPSKGYGSLPYSDAQQNPNLIRVYIDAQHDYLNDRIYLLGSLVVASEGGVEPESRRRSIVHLTDGPPESAEVERDLFLRWIEETLAAVVELAAPDENGRPCAPIHLIFYNRYDQRVLLDGLARHFEAILGATPLYDFITQLAAFDSALATFLDQEIRELKNYPMVCQSLQAVASYLRFDWNRPTPYREVFRTRLFDYAGKFDEPPREERPWYTSRARFNSQIPLEYAYAAWNQLEVPAGETDDFAAYRGATPDLLIGFQARRLEALEWIAKDFKGNKQTEKSPFSLPDLATFEQKAQTLAQALDEFVLIERLTELSDWKAARLAPPERRVLSGITLLGRYDPVDQPAEVAERNAENEQRWRRGEEYRAEAKRRGAALTAAHKQETAWNQEDLLVRLRLDAASIDCDLDEALALTTLRDGDRVVVMPRTDVDSRLPAEQQTPYTPTPKQMLYGTRAELVRIIVERDAAGRATTAHAELRMLGSRGGPWSGGFAFGSFNRPFTAGGSYTLDPDPNDFYGYYCWKVTQGLRGGGTNTLYNRLVAPNTARVCWPEAAAAAQERFMAGLDALQAAGLLHPFEASKREYIAERGADPILLVQGPPGTGKSYSTAFALFARMQGAMAAGRDFRAFITCKTHAATDVLLDDVVHVQGLLRGWRERCPEIVAEHFDERLLAVPLYRMGPRRELPDGVTAFYPKHSQPPGDPRPTDVLAQQRWCVVAAAPGGTYRLTDDRWHNDLFGHELCNCLVLDEASQMNLPEAAMAALLLAEDGQVIVVGDHRQMPPIIKHDWQGEPRRTFKEFRAYQSLFLTLRHEVGLQPIQFQESFRLHAVMAEFLRQEIYQQDGIPFFSHREKTLPPGAYDDPFVAAALHHDHPLVVVVHDEAESLVRNTFEGELIAPVLEALADPDGHALEAEHGLGVVVPHRAQRAVLQSELPWLAIIDPATGAVTRSAVDTVERFQGDERTVILVSATESDPQYLLTRSEFLLDPRRLTVALSRAKSKMILVASRSVFTLFSADEETFANSQLWKNLLRRTCTVPLWHGDRDGRSVEVWGSNNHRAPLG